MSYNFTKLIAFSPIVANNSTIWHYSNTDDTITTIEAPAYFLPSDDSENLASLIKVGDAMYLYGSNGTAWVSVTGVSPIVVADVIGPSEPSPSFSVSRSGNINNWTGDGNIRTVPYNNLISNTGGGFDTGTATYTAPKDGLYLFAASVQLTEVQMAFIEITLGFQTPNGYFNLADMPLNLAGTVNIAISGSVSFPLLAGQQTYLQLNTSTVSSSITLYGGPYFTTMTGYWIGPV